MKRAIFILSFIAFTTGIDDDFAERVAEELSISKTNMQICMNKTNVVSEDFMNLDQLLLDNVETVDINKSILKIGCLFACVLQKKGMLSGSHINVEKIREFVNSKMRSSKGIDMSNRILNKCTDQVKSKTDECEVTIKLLLCVATEVNRLRIMAM